MALTPAEKQKAYRDRLKQKMKAARNPASWQSQDGIRDSFARFLADDEEAQSNALSFIGETLASVGLNAPDWERDEDPEWDPNWHTANRKLLGKVERMVGGFIDVAKELADLINRFKLQEIDRALAAIENADLSDADAKKQALAEIVRLTELRKRLDKEFRVAFREYWLADG